MPTTNDVLIRLRSEYKNQGLSELKESLGKVRTEMNDLYKSGQRGSQAYTDLKDKANTLTVGIRALKREFNGQSAEVKMSSQQMASFGANLTVVAAGLSVAFTQIKSTISNFINETNKLKSAQLGLESISKFKGIDSNDAIKSIQNLELVKNGLLNIGDASLALKNLLSTGFSLPQSIELIKRLGDAAAFGKQNSLEFGYAITSATEGIKNGNSALVDNAGVTKNISVIMKEAGMNMEDLSDSTKKGAALQALYAGLLRETAGQLGDAAKLTKEYAGKQAQFDAQLTVAKQNIGRFLQEALTPILKLTTDVVGIFNHLPTSLKVVTVAVIGLGAAMAFLNVNMPTIAKAFVLINSLLLTLPSQLKLVIGGISLLTAAVIAFNGSLTIMNIELGGLPTIIGLVVTGILGISTAFNTASMNIDEFTQKNTESISKITQYNVEIKDAENKLKDLKLVQEAMAVSTVRTVEQQSQYNESLKNVSNTYPQLFTNLDTHTGKLIINGSALSDVIKKEEDRLKILNDSRNAQASIAIGDIIEATKKQVKEYQNAIDKAKELEDAIKQGGKNETDSVNGDTFVTSVEELNEQLSEQKLKLGESQNATEKLDNAYKDFIKTGLETGHLTELIEQNKNKISQTDAVQNAFFNALSSLAGVAVNNWNSVTDAVERLKNSMNTLPQMGPDAPTPNNLQKRITELQNEINNSSDAKANKERQKQIDLITKQKDNISGVVKSGSKTKEKKIETIQDYISYLKKEVELNEIKFGAEGLTYEKALELLDTKKALLDVTKNNLSAEAKELALVTNKVDFYNEQADLQNKILDKKVKFNKLLDEPAVYNSKYNTPERKPIELIGKDFMEYYNKLQEVKINGMDDGLTKDIAKINLKYDIEIQKTQELIDLSEELRNKKLQLIETERNQEIQQVKVNKKQGDAKFALESLASSVSAFYQVLQNHGNIGEGFKAMLKSILASVINFVEGLILAAKAKVIAESALGFWPALLKELPEIILAIGALETAKAFVGGFYTGGRMDAGQIALVGENADGSINSTTEMWIPDRPGTILNAKNTQALLNSSVMNRVASQPQSIIQKQYFVLETDSAKMVKAGFSDYQNYKNWKAI